MLEEKLKQIQEIDIIVREKIIDLTGKSLAVLDGIVDTDLYFGAKYKILWVLKEPNDTTPNEKGLIGDWDMREFIYEGVTEYPNWKRTYLPILYTVAGIFNNCLYDDLDNYDENDEKMMDLLKEIGYINIKKIPGGAGANNEEIAKAYNVNKDILLKQIEVYEPDILIFANTIGYFMNDLSIDEKQLDEKGYYATKDRLYIKSTHPNQRNSSQEDYCNNIIQCVQNWQDTNQLL